MENNSNSGVIYQGKIYKLTFQINSMFRNSYKTL